MRSPLRQQRSSLTARSSPRWPMAATLSRKCLLPASRPNQVWRPNQPRSPLPSDRMGYLHSMPQTPTGLKPKHGFLKPNLDFYRIDVTESQPLRVTGPMILDHPNKLWPRTLLPTEVRQVLGASGPEALERPRTSSDDQRRTDLHQTERRAAPKASGMPLKTSRF